MLLGKKRWNEGNMCAKENREYYVLPILVSWTNYAAVVETVH